MATKRQRERLTQRIRQARRCRTKPRKQQQEPRQQQPEADEQSEDPHIGYFAREGRDVLRHEDDAVVIVGSRSVMQQILQRRGRTTMTICDITFCEVTMGLVEGAAFCFDDQAYARLVKPAQEAGLPLQDRVLGEADAAGEPAFRLQLDFGVAGGE